MRRTPLARGTKQLKRSALARKTRLRQKRAKPRRSSRVRDPAHLEFVRRLPCCLCNRGPRSEPHHDTEKRGMGQKADDTRTIPMCHRHHMDAQSYAGPFKGWDKYRMRAWFEEQLARVMAAKEEYVRLNELSKDDVALIISALEEKSERMAGDLAKLRLEPVMGTSHGQFAHETLGIVATRCDELAQRIRGAA